MASTSGGGHGGKQRNSGGKRKLTLQLKVSIQETGTCILMTVLLKHLSLVIFTTFAGHIKAGCQLLTVYDSPVYG